MCPRRSSLSYEQINHLIKLVQENPCLWNPDDDNYNDRNITADTWINISTKLQLSERMVRCKWKNLRDLFIRELKRLYGSDLDDYMGKWKHFRKLWFLYRSDSQGHATGEAECTEINEPLEVKIEPNLEDETLFFDEESNECQDALNNPKTDPVDVSDTIHDPPPKRRRVETYSDEDCDMMFLKSLIPYFKLLMPIRKLVVRNKIQELLLEEVTTEHSKEQS